VAAYQIHRCAWPRVCESNGGSGEFQDWDWYLGSSRITWHHPGCGFVYKIELMGSGHANETEHRNAETLRWKNKTWAPLTSLYLCGDSSAVPILAMVFYPYEIYSPSEIPEDASKLGLDVLPANFRRTEQYPSGCVKAIDLGSINPTLEMWHTALCRQAILEGPRSIKENRH
jgi:hypothetical protein